MKRISAGLVVALVLTACVGSVGAPTPPGAQECVAASGSPTDLSSEPRDWLNYGTYLRWTDREGCLIRIDVISHHQGAGHCDWEQMQFITIGKPLGTSIEDGKAEQTVRYLWDPNGVLPDGPFGTEIERDELPGSAYDSGFRRDGRELWLDESDESVVYVVVGSTVQVWEASLSGLCA